MCMCPLLLANVDLCRKLTLMHLSCMLVRRGEWQGTPAVYKVWDLGDSIEPVLDMQAELDAYQALRPLQVSVSI